MTFARMDKLVEAMRLTKLEALKNAGTSKPGESGTATAKNTESSVQGIVQPRVAKGRKADPVRKDVADTDTQMVDASSDRDAQESAHNTVKQQQSDVMTSGSLTFFHLPPGLRLMVYRYALPKRSDVSSVPALLRCNARICEEASPLCARVLTISFNGGVACQYPDSRLLAKRFGALAKRIKHFTAGGILILLRIEVECCGNTHWGAPLAPLIAVLEEESMLHVKVLPHPQECMDCAMLGYSPKQAQAVRSVRNLIDRVIDGRDNGYIKAAAYLAEDDKVLGSEDSRF
jgi:hypothetical protein